MSQIDKYIQHMARIDAVTLTLSSGGPVVAKLASGVEKSSSQTVDHATLVTTVQEAAPAQALDQIRASRPARFQYPADAPTVTIDVVPTPGAWRVTIYTPRAEIPNERLSVPPGVDLGARASAPNLAPGDMGARLSFPNAPPGERGSLPNVPAGDRLSAPNALPGERLSFSNAPPAAPARGTIKPALASISSSAVQPVAPPLAPTHASGPAPAPVLSAPPAQVSLPAPPAASIAPAPPPEPFAEYPYPGDTTSLDRLLKMVTSLGASDLHISTSRVPMMRLHGEIKSINPELPVLTTESLKGLVLPIMPPHSRAQFARTNDTDYAYELPGVARFRVNVFVDRKGPCAVLRRIPVDIVPADELGLSKTVMELCDLPKGLVLVTGPTGSGKSTTLAAMIDRINATRKDHIITVEDPIEFVHRNKKCLVNQREVRVHTDSFKDALRAALREDPDIVLVGEMRDLETVAIAIETAETGHLVFGTLHTRTAPSTVDRIIDQFPAERQSQIRMMLADSLKGVIAQTLCKKVGGGRIAAYEVLVVTPAVSNLIREGKTFQLHGIMQTGRQHGMMTLTDALCALVQAGKIDAKEAWFRSINKHEMKTAFEQRGIPLPQVAGKDV
jgi:twitching motility protein PilT